MNEENIVLVCFALLGIGMLGLLLVTNKESYTKKCIAQSSEGGRERVCQDKDTTEMAYDNGTATEFSNFKNKGWSTVSPGDVQFPTGDGCGDGYNSIGWKQPHDWVAWDFSDFVGKD